jgi:predicted glycosyltransferase
MAVGEVFKKRFPGGNLFFIQAGVQQPKARIDRLGKVYLLPGAFMDRRHFREPVRGAGPEAGQRALVCSDIVTRERPDLFITEFFPLGREECRHELIPSLAKASAKGAALWAVAGYPLLTGKDNEWRRKIIKLYQKVIIFSPVLEKEFIADSFSKPGDKREYLGFFEQNAAKIVFAGYLLPCQEVVRIHADENPPKPPVPKGACRVAVLRGGGAYFPKIIAQAIHASELLGKDFYLTAVAGPATTPKEWHFFTALAGKKKVNNLSLLRSVSDYEALVEESDVCVSMASYHTSVMLLKHRKKAVLIPFEGYGPMSFHEQPARAALFKEVMGAKVLYAQDLTAKNLTAAIKEAAASRKISSRVPKEWLQGADVLGKELTGLFGR